MGLWEASRSKLVISLDSLGAVGMSDPSLCFPQSTDFPARVVRALGPAARKEVTIAASKEEACRAVQEIMQVDKSFINPWQSKSWCSVLRQFVIPATGESIFGRNLFNRLRSLLRVLLCAPDRAGRFWD